MPSRLGQRRSPPPKTRFFRQSSPHCGARDRRKPPSIAFDFTRFSSKTQIVAHVTHTHLYKGRAPTAKQKEQQDARADLVRAQTRERVAKATLAEMEARKRTGELLELSDVTWRANDMMTRLRQGFLALPSIIMRRMPSGMSRDDRHKVRMVVEEEVRTALNQLSRLPARLVEDEDSRRVSDDE
jgi:phage terminase Nu1 subunit (DNA packaging protein)